MRPGLAGDTGQPPQKTSSIKVAVALPRQGVEFARSIVIQYSAKPSDRQKAIPT